MELPPYLVSPEPDPRETWPVCFKGSGAEVRPGCIFRCGPKFKMVDGS